MQMARGINRWVVWKKDANYFRKAQREGSEKTRGKQAV